MRMVFNNDSIEEIVYMSATPCWNETNGSTEDNPEMYSVEYMMVCPDECAMETLGEYKLDGTKKTYQAAVENFERIIKQLAIAGYVFDSDFENFEFY